MKLFGKTDIFIVNDELNFVFHAYTPYQLLVMSYIALVCKQNFPKVKCILIRNELLLKSQQFFNWKIWNQIIEDDTGQLGGIDFLGFRHVGTFFSWAKNIRKVFKTLEKVLGQLPDVHAFFFSSGDNVLIPAIRGKNRQAILVCVGEGSASYNVNTEIQHSSGIMYRLKQWGKVHLFGVLRRFTTVPFQVDDFERPMDGGKEVNAFIDVRPRAASESFRRKRWLWQISFENMRNEFPNIIKRGAFSIIPDGLKDGSAALLITTRLSEDNFVTQKVEMEFYKSVIDIFKENGVTVYIKPHPRESLEKFSLLGNDVILLSGIQAIPFEILLYVIRVRYFVNIASSACWNAYDAKVASCYVMLNNLYFNVVSQNIPLIRYYNDMGGCLGDVDGVVRPDTWDELRRVVSDNCANEI